MASILRREQYAAAKPFSFSDVERERDELLAGARTAAAAHAQRVAHAALEAAEAERKRGYEIGYREGVQAARREAAERAKREEQAARKQVDEQTRKQIHEIVERKRNAMQRLSESLQAAAVAFDAEKRRLLALAEFGVVDLSQEIARRVCKTEIARNGDAVAANAREAIKLLRHEQDLELAVTPDSAELMRELLPSLIEGIRDLEHVRVVEDEEAAPGACVLRGRSATVDASIETQLERIAAALGASSVAPEA